MCTITQSWYSTCGCVWNTSLEDKWFTWDLSIPLFIWLCTSTTWWLPTILRTRRVHGGRSISHNCNWCSFLWAQFIWQCHSLRKTVITRLRCHLWSCLSCLQSPSFLQTFITKPTLDLSQPLNPLKYKLMEYQKRQKMNSKFQSTKWCS